MTWHASNKWGKNIGCRKKVGEATDGKVNDDYDEFTICVESVSEYLQVEQLIVPGIGIPFYPH